MTHNFLNIDSKLSRQSRPLHSTAVEALELEALALELELELLNF